MILAIYIAVLSSDVCGGEQHGLAASKAQEKGHVCK